MKNKLKMKKMFINKWLKNLEIKLTMQKGQNAL
jgi:hypothetical protein